MADDEQPSERVLAAAADDADEAARTDDHWEVLAAAVRRAREAVGTPGAGTALDALVEECRRSNDFVRRGGREQPRAAPPAELVGPGGAASVFPDGPSGGT